MKTLTYTFTEKKNFEMLNWNITEVKLLNLVKTSVFIVW